MGNLQETDWKDATIVTIDPTSPSDLHLDPSGSTETPGMLISNFQELTIIVISLAVASESGQLT